MIYEVTLRLCTVKATNGYHKRPTLQYEVQKVLSEITSLTLRDLPEHGFMRPFIPGKLSYFRISGTRGHGFESRRRRSCGEVLIKLFEMKS